MKKLIDSFEKTPTARLIDSASRTSSEMALYQNYQNGDCATEPNDGTPEAKTKRIKPGDGKPEAVGRIVHRIRAIDDPPDALCILGCCGRGQLAITWSQKDKDNRGALSNCDLTLLSNSNHGNDLSDAAVPSIGSLPPSSASATGRGAAGDRQMACDDPETNEFQLGRLQFGVAYDFPEMTLTLHILRAVTLPAKDLTGTSDPYVRIMLLPDKKRKITTNVKRKNLNPRWNEVFAFEAEEHSSFGESMWRHLSVACYLTNGSLSATRGATVHVTVHLRITGQGFPYSKLMSRTLYLQVLDYDRFSRDDPIGEVCIPLNEFDLVSGQTVWKNLQPCKGHTGKLGEVNVSLNYHPTNEQITVTVHEARALKAKDINGLSDPYVKIWMLHDGKKVEKKKTEVKEKTLNPVFEESFAFAVPYARVRQTALSIVVMDYDRMGRNELIGRVILGSKSGPMEVKHWNEMFAKTRQTVAQWHVLKDFG